MFILQIKVFNFGINCLHETVFCRFSIRSVISRFSQAGLLRKGFMKLGFRKGFAWKKCSFSFFTLPLLFVIGKERMSDLSVRVLKENLHRTFKLIMYITKPQQQMAANIYKRDHSLLY